MLSFQLHYFPINLFSKMITKTLTSKPSLLSFNCFENYLQDFSVHVLESYTLQRKEAG